MNYKRTLTALIATGLCAEPEESIKFTDEPKIPGYLTFPKKAVSERYNVADAFGQGYDFNAVKASVKSAAEFLERLCLFNPRKGALSEPMRYEDSGNFTNPADFFCYSEEQVPDRPKVVGRLRKEAYMWVTAKDIARGCDVLLPAQRVFLSEFSEFPIRKETTSNGAALGISGSGDAFERGLLEIIERDACMHAYLTKRRIRRIVEAPSEIEEVEDYLHRYNLEPYSFDVSTDLGVPVTVTVTADTTGIGPAITVGAGAGLTYKGALRRSIVESVQCRGYARFMKDLKFPEKLPDDDEVSSLENRLYYWYPVERIRYLNFWLKDPPIVKFSELAPKEASREKIIQKFKEKNLGLYSVDITLPEVRDAGFEVLVAVSPGLHPLYLDEAAKALYSIHHGCIPEDHGLKPGPFT